MQKGRGPRPPTISIIVTVLTLLSVCLLGAYGSTSSHKNDSSHSEDSHDLVSPDARKKTIEQTTSHSTTGLQYLRSNSGSSNSGSSNSDSSNSDSVGFFESFFSSLSSAGTYHDNEGDLTLHPIMKELNSIDSTLDQINSEEAGLEEIEDLLSTMDLMETLISNPTFLSSIPEDMKLTMSKVSSALDGATKDMRKIEEFISESSDGSSQNGFPTDIHKRRYLGHDDSRHEDSHDTSLSLSTRRRVDSDPHSNSYEDGREHEQPVSFHSKFDYIHRSKSPRRRLGSSYGPYSSSAHGTGATFENTFAYNMDDMQHLHGQGMYGYYKNMPHGAGQQLHGRSAKRRMLKKSDDGTKECVDYDMVTHKREQCQRLAACADHYSLYDLFVYYYQDDIDFDSGNFKDKKMEDTVFGEITRLRSILKEIQGEGSKRGISELILKDWKRKYLKPGNLCDSLLKKFHRFYDNIGEIGRWEGGSVTSVCRGWGTSKHVKLGEIYKFLVKKTGEFESSADLVMDMYEEFVGCAGEVNQVPVPDDEGELTSSGNPLEKNGELLLPVYVKNKGDIRDDLGQIRKEMIENLFVHNSDDDVVKYNIPEWMDISIKGLPISTSDLTMTKSDNPSNHTVEFDLSLRKAFRASFKNEFYRDETYGNKKRLMMKRSTDENILSSTTFDSFSLKDDINDSFPSLNPNPTSSPTIGPWDPDRIIFEDAINIRAFEESDELGKFHFTDGTIRILGILDIPDDKTNLCFFYDDKLTLFPDDNHALKVDGTKVELVRDYPGYQFGYTIVEPGLRVIELQFKDSGGPGAMILAWYGEEEECPSVHGWADDDLRSESLDDVDDDDIPRSKDWVDPYEYAGFSRHSFDKSIELLFGEKTTIGQVCSYANGLRNTDVDLDQLPGFCCLDAPYESDYWGEKYSCTYEYGDNRGKAKNIFTENDTVCETLAPKTTYFNEDACDTFSGTWCPNSRPCGSLVCINDMREEVKDDTSRRAFFEYLDGAPTLTKYDDVKECQDLREYFDYDPDYPDDNRICAEVQELQCLPDFSQLDGLAEESGDELEDLVINTKVVLKTKGAYNSDTAKHWRKTNFGMKTTSNVFSDAVDFIDIAGTACLNFAGTLDGVAAKICSVVNYFVLLALQIIDKAFKLIIDISVHTYNEVVGVMNFEADYNTRDATYENVVTSSQNIHTTFKAIQQVKQMLGELADNLEADDEDEDNDSRSLAESCDSDSPCKNVKDPRYKCDCTINYNHLAKQQFAGCDEFESDGDGFVDYYEDRFPPSLLLSDAALFRCDKDDPNKLCYSDEMFTEYTHAKDFLNFTLKVTDDCAPFKQKKFYKGEEVMLKGTIGMMIEHVNGTCHETEYLVTAWQNYSSNPEVLPDIDDTGIDFINPLYGGTKTIYVQVDDEDPAVTCGFTHESKDSDISYSIDEKTLYYYGSSGGSGRKGDLIDSSFFFNIDDNCDADITVDVVVKSNELDRSSAMVEVFESQLSGFNTQVELYYSATSCDEIAKSPGSCDQDSSISNPIRFYDITVTATDSSGRVGKDNSRIIIVPKCDTKDKKSGMCEKRGKYYYYKRHYMDDLAHQSRRTYKLSSMSLIWKSNLESIMTAPPTSSPAPSISKGKGKGGPPSKTASSVLASNHWVGEDDSSAEYLHDVEMELGILVPIVKTCDDLSFLDTNEIKEKCEFVDHFDGYDPAMSVCRYTCYKAKLVDDSDDIDFTAAEPTLPSSVESVLDDLEAEYLHDVKFKYGILTPVIQTCGDLVKMSLTDIESHCMIEKPFAGYETAKFVCPDTCKAYIDA